MQTAALLSYKCHMGGIAFHPMENHALAGSDRLRYAFRNLAGVSPNGMSPHRFGFWLPVALKAIGLSFVVAAIFAVLNGVHQ